MSTDYDVFKVGSFKRVSLHEHSSYVNLCVNEKSVIDEMNGEQMVKLALKLLAVAGYVHGDDFVEKSVEANDPRRIVPWRKDK